MASDYASAVHNDGHPWGQGRKDCPACSVPIVACAGCDGSGGNFESACDLCDGSGNR